MFKLNFRRVFGLFLIIFVAGSLATGCYDDSELRESIENLKTQFVSQSLCIITESA